MTGFEAAVDALRTDARRWGGGAGSMADTLRAASAVAASLHVSPEQLSWASVDSGLAEAYEQLQQKVARVVGEGADNCETVASNLRRAADAYEGVEVDNADALRRAWQRRDG